VPDRVRVQGSLTGSRPAAGLWSAVVAATSGYLRREFELWRWRRAYVRRLPPPSRDPREPVLEPSIPLPGASEPGVRSAVARASAPRRSARKSPPGLAPADAPRG
jgi:hypothetical protein